MKVRFASLVLLLSACQNPIDETSITSAFGWDKEKRQEWQLLAPTREGPVRGQIIQDGAARAWFGIPFARPPVGELRWKAPLPPERRSGVYEATQHKDPCPQYSPDFSAVIGNEDCLHLDIVRPAGHHLKKLPVYVWIHGGANSFEIPRNESLGLVNLATKGQMVVVTIRYRLGPLGWFRHEALAGNDGLTNSGNFGTLDIIRSLRWIRRNIRAFGGDPHRVTISGASAGATNALTMLLSPEAKGLFHRAIVQSGAADSFSTEAATASAGNILAALAVKEGLAADTDAAAAVLARMSAAETAAWLRGKSPEELLSVYPKTGGGGIAIPTVFLDGRVIHADGYAAFRNGNWPNKVPVILGGNMSETKLFLYGSPVFNGETLQDPAVADLYRLVAGYGSESWNVRGRDNLARDMSNSGAGGIYTYQFNWGEDDLPAPYQFLYGASHLMNIDLFFGNQDGLFSRIAYSEENLPGVRALSDAIIAYTAGFARTGNPNRGRHDLPAWNSWTAGGENRGMLLDAKGETAVLEMNAVPYTAEGVEARLQAEPRADEVRPHL